MVVIPRQLAGDANLLAIHEYLPKGAFFGLGVPSELKVEQVEDKRQIEELLKWKGHANKAALVWASACMGALAVGTSVTGNVEKVKEKLWQLMQ